MEKERGRGRRKGREGREEKEEIRIGRGRNNKLISSQFLSHTATNLDVAKVGIWLSPRKTDRFGRLRVGGLLTLGWALNRDMSN